MVMPADRRDLRRRIQAVAFDQAGYFTAAQAREAGYSYQAQKYHVDHGNWLRVDRGLFRLPEWPGDVTDSYVRWAVWSGGRGVVSHESALTLHGLSDADPARVHLTVPPGFRAEDPHVRLAIGDVPAGDREGRRGFEVTTVERTLLDVAGAGVSQEILSDAVHDAIRRDLTSARRLRRRAADATDKAALGIERALAHEANREHA